MYAREQILIHHYSLTRDAPVQNTVNKRRMYALEVSYLREYKGQALEYYSRALVAGCSRTTLA